MQLALIIPLTGENIPPGLLPAPGHPIQPPGAGIWPPQGQPGQPLPGAPSREEIKAAIKAKLDEWVAGLNPPSREEVKAKLEHLAAEIRDKLAEHLPEGCIKQPK